MVKNNIIFLTNTCPFDNIDQFDPYLIGNNYFNTQFEIIISPNTYDRYEKDLMYSGLECFPMVNIMLTNGSLQSEAMGRDACSGLDYFGVEGQQMALFDPYIGGKDEENVLKMFSFL